MHRLGSCSRCCLAILLLAAQPATHAAGGAVDAAVPHFKWGQSKEKLYVTVMVKDLVRDSVSVRFTDESFIFECMDDAGKPYKLDAELFHDIDNESCAWEYGSRADRKGDTVVATLHKRFAGRWDSLVSDPKSYRRVLDKDWAREDPNMEPDDDTYFDDHVQYMKAMTLDGLNSAFNSKGKKMLILSFRHKACNQCLLMDDLLAAKAKELRSGSLGAWSKPISVGTVDVRRERRFAQKVGFRCAAEPLACRFYAFAPEVPGVPVLLRGRHESAQLLADLQRLARPQFRSLATWNLSQVVRAQAVRGLVIVLPGASMEVHQVSHSLRLWLDIAVAEDITGLSSQGLELESAPLAVIPPHETEPIPYRGRAQDLHSWLFAHAIPLVANTSKFEDDEVYEDLRLPIARLFVQGRTLSGENGSAHEPSPTQQEIDAAARLTITKIAKRFRGRLAFVVRNGTRDSFLWRKHGLPGWFPAVAFATGMQYNASKYPFLQVPFHASAEYWGSDELMRNLTIFLEDALAGRLTKAWPSEAPPKEEGILEPDGTVHKFVGRECLDLVANSHTEALVEAYDQYRRDHERRTLQLDLLAGLLWQWNITTYRFDLGKNDCPDRLLPPVAAGYSGYYFLPRRAKDRGLKFQKMKKLDPSFDRVLQFVAKHTDAPQEGSARIEAVPGMELFDATAIFMQLEALLAERDDTPIDNTAAARYSLMLALLFGALGIGWFYLSAARGSRASTASAERANMTRPELASADRSSPSAATAACDQKLRA